MGFKTIFVITVTALVTIILMNNSDEVTFWIFGDVRVSKLAVLGIMFVLGFIVGGITFRTKKKVATTYSEEETGEPNKSSSSSLSDEDREYIN